MNKVLKGLLVLVLMLSVACCFSACSSPEEDASELASTVLEKSVNVAKSSVDEYVEDVDKATPDEVQDLKDDGNNLLSTLDDIDNAVTEAKDSISEDTKTKVTADVEEMRQKLNDALAKLDAK